MWQGGTYTISGSRCINLNFTWDANGAWSSNPGFGPSSYGRYLNGSFYGNQSANYPNDVTWNSGFDLNSGQTVTLEIIANFSGGLESEAMEKSWRCSNGNMIPQ